MVSINLSQNLNSSTEIVHFYSDQLLIESKHRCVEIYYKGSNHIAITLPFTRFDILGGSRLLRRLFRLDKCNVSPLDPKGESIFLIRQGIVYKYDQMNGLRATLKLRQSRNILHTDICRTISGRIIFAEYGSNADRRSIPIYSSEDNAESWRVAYEIPAGIAKHVHGVYADKYSSKVWVFTGDGDGESWVIEANEDFSEVRFHGDGSQTYRACTVFFTPEKVVWAMDSPLMPSQTVHLDRRTGKVEPHGSFPGPLWYGLEVPTIQYYWPQQSSPVNR